MRKREKSKTAVFLFFPWEKRENRTFLLTAELPISIANLIKLNDMKKKILTLSLSRLDSGAHFNYLEAVLARVNKTTEVKTAVATELATLKTAFDTENKFLKVS